LISGDRRQETRIKRIEKRYFESGRLKLKREKDQDKGIKNVEVRNLKSEAQIRNVLNIKSPEGA